MRAHLGRVTHLASLDQYRRAMLNAVSWNSGLKWPNDLEGQGRWHQFPWPNERISRCILGTNLAILAQINYTLLRGQAKFIRILSRIGQNMAKMSLMVNVNDLNFQYQLRVYHGAHLVQICWFKLKSVKRCRADQQKFTDGIVVSMRAPFMLSCVSTDSRIIRWDEIVLS